jgi:hypothetical protein
VNVTRIGQRHIVAKYKKRQHSLNCSLIRVFYFFKVGLANKSTETLAFTVPEILFVSAEV